MRTKLGKRTLREHARQHNADERMIVSVCLKERGDCALNLLGFVPRVLRIPSIGNLNEGFGPTHLRIGPAEFEHIVQVVPVALVVVPPNFGVPVPSSTRALAIKVESVPLGNLRERSLSAASSTSPMICPNRCEGDNAKGQPSTQRRPSHNGTRCFRFFHFTFRSRVRSNSQLLNPAASASSPNHSTAET